MWQITFRLKGINTSTDLNIRNYDQVLYIYSYQDDVVVYNIYRSQADRDAPDKFTSGLNAANKAENLYSTDVSYHFLGRTFNDIVYRGVASSMMSSCSVFDEVKFRYYAALCHTLGLGNWTLEYKVDEIVTEPEYQIIEGSWGNVTPGNDITNFNDYF